MLQVWSSIEDVAGPQLRTKIGVIEVKLFLGMEADFEASTSSESLFQTLITCSKKLSWIEPFGRTTSESDCELEAFVGLS